MADMAELVAVEWENIRVAWVNLDEGISGDYNAGDPNDINLLRFDVLKYNPFAMEYEAIDDASYCTQVPADTEYTILTGLAQVILERVFENASNDLSIKKICEELSWIDPSYVDLSK